MQTVYLSFRRRCEYYGSHFRNDWIRTEKWTAVRIFHIFKFGYHTLIKIFFMRGSRKFFYEGKEDLNSTRPSSARQRNAIEMAFRWQADDGPTLKAGLVALCFFRGSRPVLLRKPIFLEFSRGVRTLAPPHRTWLRCRSEGVFFFIFSSSAVIL